MATFSEYILPIKTILQTSYIPTAFDDINTNYAYIKTDLEDLVNNFEIDITNVEIGKTTPVNLLNSKRLQIIDSVGVSSYGLHLKERLDYASIGYFSIVDDSGLKSDFMSDYVTVNIELLGAGNIDITGSVTCVGLISTSFASIENVSVTGSITEDYEQVEASMTLNGTVGEATITLTTTTARHLYVTVVPTIDVYDPDGTDWGSVDELHVYLDMDSSNAPNDGQVFTITLVDVVDYNGDALGDALPADLLLTPGTRISDAAPILFSNLVMTDLILAEAGTPGQYSYSVSIQNMLKTGSTDPFFHIISEYAAY